jgi:serine/threonine-protein kinase
LTDNPTPSRSGLDSVLTSGFQFAGRYRPEHLIGRGGMANVYLGTDTRLQRRVAIKALRPEVAIDKESRKRFQREAHAVSTMGHPSIVRVYDTGEELIPAASTETPIPFIVMEYIDGKILRKLMDNGAFEPKVAVHITLGILDALDESHRAGIIHRDIKPGNVMVTPTGLVKVCDFGIAQAIEDPTNDPSAIVGTAQYFSPEQAKGELIDGRSDLYSTAVVLFEMVTGTPVFTGDSSVAVAFQHVTQTAPRARSRRPELSPELDFVIAKALEKDRTLRYGSASEFAAALRAITTLWADASTPRTETAAESLGLSVNRSAYSASEAQHEQGKSPSMDLSELRDSLNSDTPPKATTIRWVVLTSAAIAVVASVVAGMMFWVLTLGGSPGVTSLAVEIPAVALKQYSEAEAMMVDLGLVVKHASASSDSVPVGVVISTSPEAGIRVATGEIVTIVESTGPVLQVVPDLNLSTLAKATALIEGAGFALGTVTKDYSATVPKNSVISATPAAGTPLAAGQPVNLIISTGLVKVPNVVGSSIQKAKAMLEAVTVQYAVVVTTDLSCAGSVVKSQSIRAGDGPQNQTITLVYCAG